MVVEHLGVGSDIELNAKEAQPATKRKEKHDSNKASYAYRDKEEIDL